MKYFALLILFVLSCSSAALAQQEEDVVKVKSNLVNIDVFVKDKKGKYISDLKPEDFTIVENGVAQKIEFFDAPLMRNEAKRISPGGVGSQPSGGCFASIGPGILASFATR